MITHLSVRNYALIDELSIDFESGLSVITGETGSGKSIILGALGLALGERADHGALSSSDQKCVVEVTFHISDIFKEFFQNHDLDFDPTTIIRREITISGKSRSFVNDTPVNLTVLKQLGVKLVDIHSQHEHALLGDENFRFEFLDALGANQAHKKEYQAAFETWDTIKKELFQLKETQAQAAQDADYRDFQFQELDALNLDQLDQETTELEASTLDNAEDILTSLSEFKGLMDSDLGALTRIQTGLARLQSIPNNSRATELSDRLQSVLIELMDLADEAENWSEEIEVDPSKLSQLQDQLDSLYRAQKKHNVGTVEDLRSIRDKLEQSTLNQDLAAETIIKLESEVASTELIMREVGKRLSERRARVTTEIQESLNELFRNLDLPHAHIEFCLKKSDHIGPQGLDKIDINFSANPGSPLKPIESVASGGEISRVILAIKACFSQAIELPTLILDEIDTGVSGETARKVAKVMAGIGESSQVIAISHLPQIAGQAKHHFKVSKITNNDLTTTQIQQLNPEERVDEIAEMMTGKSLTEAARESARSLIAD